MRASLKEFENPESQEACIIVTRNINKLSRIPRKLVTNTVSMSNRFSEVFVLLMHHQKERTCTYSKERAMRKHPDAAGSHLTWNSDRSLDR
jgi:hypothetical protein